MGLFEYHEKGMVRIEYRRKFVILSNCILNQMAVVIGEKRASGPFPFVKVLVDHGVGMLQLPCPEMNELGPQRPGMSYKEYDAIEGYRERCRVWLQPVFNQIKSYLANGDQLLGMIGINQSPNCSISDQRGVWMEIIIDWLNEESIECPLLEVPTWYSEDEQGTFDEEVIRLIKGDND